ncbi:hypothetical protein DRH27_04655 [Candidatus Falkowbacteria bacterium]|nr:MAG: hypothetical protein DRH27_04655 [Candidatus Falkowbacteria bacterium]
MGAEIMMGTWGSRVSEIAPIKIDGITNAMAGITYPHLELHGGTHYVYRSYASVSKNAVKDILIVTPDSTKFGHFIVGFSFTGGQTLLALYEGVTTSNDGTEKTVRNRRRPTGDDATLKIYQDPTVSGGAVAENILQDGVFGINDKKSFGGGDRDNEEIILNPATKYLLRADELDVAAMYYNFFFDWYEHTDKR